MNKMVNEKAIETSASIQSIRSGLLGYEQAEAALRTAILAGEHMLLIGEPGTGKSLFARNMFRQFDGEMFVANISRFSDESAILGAPDIRALRDTGRLTYETTGTILGADWVVLDEMFDGSDALLRVLLPILNERTFTRGSFHVELPLETAVATSNYTRITEQTQAVIDRFALVLLAPTPAKEVLRALYNSRSDAWDVRVDHTVPFSHISEMRAELDYVDIPSRFVDVMMEFAEEHRFSPRRQVKAARLVRAKALLRENDGADPNVAANDIVDVLPLMLLPTGDGPTALRERQEKATKELQDRITAAVLVDEQTSWILNATRKSPNECRNDEDLKTLVTEIKIVAAIKPVNDEVAKLQKDTLSALRSRHLHGLKKLGLAE